MGGQGLCSVTADQNKILIITTQALAAHFDFTSFLSRLFFSSWPQLFLHQGCFWLGFHFFF